MVTINWGYLTGALVGTAVTGIAVGMGIYSFFWGGDTRDPVPIRPPGVSAPAPDVALGQMLDGSYRIMQGNGFRNAERVVPYHSGTPDLATQINQDINNGSFAIMQDTSGREVAARRIQDQVPFYKETPCTNTPTNIQTLTQIVEEHSQKIEAIQEKLDPN